MLSENYTVRVATEVVCRRRQEERRGKI